MLLAELTSVGNQQMGHIEDGLAQVSYRSSMSVGSDSEATSGYEQDCPWFDPAWLLDHSDFPLAASVAAAIQKEGNVDV